MKRSLSFLLPVLTLLMTSCSTMVEEGGKKIDLALRKGSRRADVQALLGAPIKTAAFHPSKSARQVQELQGKAARPETLLSGYEDYRFQGWVYNPSDSAGLAIGDVLTLGALGVIGTPVYVLGQQSRWHGYRVYYDARGSYFGHFETEDSGNRNAPWVFYQSGIR